MGPGSPFLRPQPQRGFSPLQGASLEVRDRLRPCSSDSNAIRQSQLCQAGRRSLPTSFLCGGVPPSRAVGSFGGSEGPRPSCYRTKALRNPPPEFATAAKDHLGHSLEDGTHILCSQAEHCTETLHPNGPPLPSPGPSGRSQAPVLSRSFFTSCMSLRRSVLQPTTVMGTSLKK